MAVTIPGACDDCCVTLQMQLEEINPNAFGTPQNCLIDSLVSSANGGNVSFFQSVPEFGKPMPTNACKLTVEYYPPTCEDALDECPDICTPVTSRTTRNCLDVTVECVKGLEGYWTEDEFRCICDNQNDRAAREISNAARDLKRAITKDLAVKIYEQVGPYSSGVASLDSPKAVNIVNPEGYINPAAMSVIRSEHRKQHCQGNPFIIGGDILFLWDDVRRVAGSKECCDGENPAFGLNVCVDYDAEMAVQEVAGDTLGHALSWCPGAVKLMEWYENVGTFEKFESTYTFTTLTIDGITYDYKIRYDECTRTFTWTLCKHYDIFCLPEEVYAPCMVGNQKLHWVFGCGPMDCDSLIC